MALREADPENKARIFSGIIKESSIEPRSDAVRLLLDEAEGSLALIRNSTLEEEYWWWRLFRF